MKSVYKHIYILKGLITFIFLFSGYSCSKNSDDFEYEIIDNNEETDNEEEVVSNKYANIDFNHWKITLPVDLNNDDKPDEYQPSSLINFGYQKQKSLIPFLYDDETDKSIVFYTYPAGATTGNSKYPRTELREQQTPGSNYNNWMLEEEGILEGELKVEDISKDLKTSRTYQRVIVMQIHGIKSQNDMNTYGFSSNHAPPLLKMTWIEGHIFAYKKTLVNNATTGLDLFDDSAATWTDLKHDFGYVGFEKFKIKIVAQSGKLTITANNKTHVFEDVSLQKWPFENYFKAGNYLTATDKDAFTKVKYYSLNVSH